MTFDTMKERQGGAMNERRRTSHFNCYMDWHYSQSLTTIIKGVAGIIANSRALIADAVHSASDIISSVVILFGVKIAMKPPDQEHPYGHGKAENIASIIVALLLILVGVEISISSLKIFWGE